MKQKLTIGDLDLFICYKEGEEIDQDCSCDSSFIKKIMGTLAKEISDYYFWVPLKTTITL